MIRYILILLALMSIPLLALADDDCDKAKEVYQQGVNLLEFSERQAAFEQAVKLCPTYAEAHVNLADAHEYFGLEKKKDFSQQSQHEGDKLLDEAEQHYKRAIELKRHLVSPRLGLAVVNIAQGRYPIAIQNYEEVLRLKPDEPFIRERIELLKKIDPPNDEKIRISSKIIDQIKNKKNLGDFTQMGFKDSVVRDIENRRRESFKNILFEGWSSAIKPGDPIKQLNEIGKALTSHEMSLVNFMIEGHANTVGPFEDNMTVSDNRAKAVKEYLVKNFSIDPNRIITQGFGYTRPKYEQGNDPRNRRVEVIFFNDGPQK